MENTENIVLDIFCNAMNTSISIKDNFFDLGGDSVEMTDIISKINNRLGLHYKLSYFLSLNGSIEEIIDVIKSDLSLSKES